MFVFEVRSGSIPGCGEIRSKLQSVSRLVKDHSYASSLGLSFSGRMALSVNGEGDSLSPELYSHGKCLLV